MRADQQPDGQVPVVIPYIEAYHPNGFFFYDTHTSAAWGDAAVLLPWTLYQLSLIHILLRWNSLELKVTVLVIVVVLFWVLFHLTAYGKNCRAIGSCMETARQSGVNVDRTKIASFALMGALAGLLGFFSLIRTGTSTVLTGNDLYINVLCAALLGGLPLMGGAAATFRSVVIGSATMSSVSYTHLDVYKRQVLRQGPSAV